MFFYFLTSVFTTPLNYSKQVYVPTNEKIVENSLYSNKSTNAAVCHKLSHQENNIYMKKTGRIELRGASTSRFHPYKKSQLTLECSSVENTDEPLDLSVKTIKTENTIPHVNIQCYKDQKIANYIFLIYNLRSFIFKCELEDFYIRSSRSILKFKDKNDHKTYMRLRMRIYSWVTQTIIINELLARLVSLILTSKIDEKSKIVLLYQLHYCHETMSYTNKMLPFKKNYKPLSADLILTYVRITIRLPILMSKLNLLEAFLDFFAMFGECCIPHDTVCQEIQRLLENLDNRIFIIFNGLDKFIKIISSMSKILEKAE
ncbi:uncharacterized protein VNE69_03328 [Vairimorpha necatrix]|uniref:Uncharacterized protein n=1 Tax=Vairimorpha necatrix TaxID=6039 RepID=A0AAX4JB81_9MICR